MLAADPPAMPTGTYQGDLRAGAAPAPRLGQPEISSPRRKRSTRLARHQLLLPPRLAALIRQLASQPAPATTLTRLAGPPRWLLPGNDPTRPASHAHLCTGLRRHGITTHAARNTAVGTLAAELPAPILASITGLNINTATSWTRSTSRDWTDYLAARTPHQDERAADEEL
jgi:hypothetical protein